MKMQVLVAALVLVCAQGAFAADDGKDAKRIPSAAICAQESQKDSLLAGRGCCSHHKGQCGCQGGRVVCCDGTLSPSCTCEADEGEKLRIGEVVFP